MEKNEIKELGIVLSSTDCGEADRLVTLFLSESGKVVSKMRGVKKPKAKLAYASFPFNLGEYLIVKRGKSSIVINCNYIDNFQDLALDLNKYYAGSATLEIVRKSLRDNTPAPKLFVLLVKSLKKLCYEDANIIMVLIKFLYDTLSYLGFKITLSDVLNTGSTAYFNFDEGKLSNEVKSGSCIQLTYEEAECLKLVIEKAYDDIDFTAITGSKNILKLFIMFFEDKVDEELNIIKNFIQGDNK